MIEALPARWMRRASTSAAPPAAWLILVGMATLSVLAWASVSGSLAEAARQKRSLHRTEVTAAIATRFAAYEQALRGAKALLKASDSVSRQDWAQFVQALGLEENYPGIQGIGFSMRVTPDAVPRITGQVRAEGLGDFHIWPDSTRESFATILYLEPMTRRNMRALGFDMTSEPVRALAMATARDTGAAAASGKVHLVQETDDDVQSGFLVYLPFYGQGPEPEDPAERRRSLQGHVYAPFRLGDFMEAVRDDLRGVRLRIHDGTPRGPDSLLYDSHPTADEPTSTTTTTLVLAGREWTLLWSGRGQGAFPMQKLLPAALLVLGGALGFAGFAAVRRGHGLRNAEDRNLQLGRIIDEAATEVLVLDARSLRILQANRGARGNLGREPETLLRLTLPDIQPDMDRVRFEQLTRPLLDGSERQVTYTTPQLRADGSRYEAEVSIQFHRASVPPAFHALVIDVTARRQAEAELNTALSESRRLLEEKETLLKEIHHRVKNNLQVIWSLIRLEAADTHDDALRGRLDTVARRIGVLGQIHQQLYASDSFSRIDITEHVRRLVDSLRELHAHQPITIAVDAETVICDIETAIPIGLMVNELVGNCLEHAFTDGRDGRVTVWIGTEDGRIVLEVSDNGIGHDPVAGRKGLGLRLIEALAGQIGARLVTDRGGGTRTRVTLPPGQCQGDDRIQPWPTEA